MFHLGSHSQAKDLAYFDIRLKSGYKNTILVKGNESEVENVCIDGSVKILTQEDLHVKRVSLKLTGKYQVDYPERSPSGHASHQVFETNCTLKVVWPNLLTSLQGEVQYGNYGDLMIKMHKLDSYLKKSSRDNSLLNLWALNNNSSQVSLESDKRPLYARAKSYSSLAIQDTSLFTIPKSGVDGTPFPLSGKSDLHSFLLPQGNYSMPFHIDLPANISESVEGLGSGKLLYKLECTVERGRFERSFYTGKHIRIVRTLHPQSLNLVDCVDYTNTWPGKVEFSVTMPRKGLALGTSVPIKLVVVPLVKGLLFKGAWAEIVQHHHFKSLSGESPEFEQVCGHEALNCDESFFGADHWEVKSLYHLPSLLKEITQSCTLKDDMIVIRHRVRVLMHIRNADGHVSELRANLPVYVYLSPTHGHVTTQHLEVDQNGFSGEADPEREDVVFPKREDDLSSDSDEDDNAPPVYEQHKLDTVYDQSSPRTPLEQLRIHGIKTQLEGSYFDLPKNANGAQTPPLDLHILLKVPSYDQAVDDDSEDIEELAPQYDQSESSASSISERLIERGGLTERSASMSNIQLSHKHRLRFHLRT